MSGTLTGSRFSLSAREEETVKVVFPATIAEKVPVLQAVVELEPVLTAKSKPLVALQLMPTVPESQLTPPEPVKRKVSPAEALNSDIRPSPFVVWKSR